MGFFNKLFKNNSNNEINIYDFDVDYKSIMEYNISSMKSIKKYKSKITNEVYKGEDLEGFVSSLKDFFPSHMVSLKRNFNKINGTIINDKKYFEFDYLKESMIINRKTVTENPDFKNNHLMMLEQMGFFKYSFGFLNQKILLSLHQFFEESLSEDELISDFKKFIS